MSQLETESTTRAPATVPVEIVGAIGAIRWVRTPGLVKGAPTFEKLGECGFDRSESDPKAIERLLAFMLQCDRPTNFATRALVRAQLVGAPPVQ